MPIAAAGFFGKLPSAGDFVQRRLPPGFVDAWDQHFENAVAESRSALGGGWHEAYHASPVWRFVLAPGVCGEVAWAGVMGPGADRVGRCFPMVIAAALATDSRVCDRVLQAGSCWFDAAESVHVEAQISAATSVDAFDQQVAALGTPLDAEQSDPLADLRGVDWAQAEHWRLPLPTHAAAVSRQLSELWQQLSNAANDWCLWWTAGGEQVPASVLVTRGLPKPQAYAGFLDAGCSAAWWRSLGVFGGLAVDRQRRLPRQEVEVAVAPPPAPVVAWLPDDPELFSDLGHIPATSAPPVADEVPVDTAAAAAAADGTAQDSVAVLHRPDCALTLVAAEVGTHDPRQQAVASVRAIGAALAGDDLAMGMQALRTRIMALNPQLRSASEDLIDPVLEDCAVIAAHVGGGQADLLRIGTAAAWHWRHGRLQPFFAKSNAPPAADAGLDDDFQDLLFNNVSLTAPGLGATTQPTCGEVFCAVNPGDRLLLVATQCLVQLPPEILARSLAMASCDDARLRIATAAGLDANAADWPLAIIEIGS
jgi:type VI secretion system protein ImpM